MTVDDELKRKLKKKIKDLKINVKQADIILGPPEAYKSNSDPRGAIFIANYKKVKYTYIYIYMYIYMIFCLWYFPWKSILIYKIIYLILYVVLKIKGKKNNYKKRLFVIQKMFIVKSFI